MMAGKIEIRKSGEKFRFVVLNRSGEKLLQSGQFDDKPSTKRAASSLARAVSGAEILDATEPVSRCDPRLELGQPARCHLREGEPRRDRQLAHGSEALEEFALNARLRKRTGIDGAETRPAARPVGIGNPDLGFG